MARCGDVGDELGSRIVATRLIVELMNLCFLMERRYRPYNKWFGTAFKQLYISEQLSPVLSKVLDAQNWRAREAQLSEAYAILGEAHNKLKITEFIEPTVSKFFNRPYLVPHAGRYVEALHDCIHESTVKALPAHVGALFQYADSTDVQSNVSLCRKYANIYAVDGEPGEPRP